MDVEEEEEEEEDVEFTIMIGWIIPSISYLTKLS